MVTLSFWEHEGYFKDIDIVIAGAGIIGLHTARVLNDRHPELRILILERSFLPYGASTRNAGFSCFGSLTELIDDLGVMPEDDVFALVKKRYDGLQLLRSVLDINETGYEEYGGYEVFTENDTEVYNECSEKTEWFNHKLYEITGIKEMYVNADNKISTFGFNNVRHLILNKGEGQIDTGLMMKSLLKRVRNMNTEVLNGIGIDSYHDEGNKVIIKTDKGFEIKAKHFIITTNAFTAQLIPEAEVIPGRAQVLVTSPVENLPFKGTFHIDRGYYYFRNVGNRVLFGGGRNLNFEAERTYEFSTTELIQNRLDEILRDIILPGRNYTVERRWSGIMGLGPVKSPVIKNISPSVSCAVRTGGMGIAIGPLIAEEAADLVIDSLNQTE